MDQGRDFDSDPAGDRNFCRQLCMLSLIHICFYRVDKSHSKEIGGTGLGLAITRSAVTMHHGTIQVASKEGEGTTFTVRIPLSYIP